jgi:2-isopropylmalate synthase
LELGYALSEGEVNSSFLRFKELADKKREISNADIESIVSDEIQMVSQNRLFDVL